MRLIEEQLAQRHSGLDLVKEGQMEARERLIDELETKARERIEMAEAESTFPSSPDSTVHLPSLLAGVL